MKKVGIAVTDPWDWTARALCEAVELYGMQPLKFSFRDVTSHISSCKIYADKIELTALDAVIVRDMGVSGDIGFRFDILRHLEELGIEIINSPGSIARCANKHETSLLLGKNSIPTPETLVTRKPDDAVEFLSKKGQIVVKPVFGYKGIGVELLENDDKGMGKLGNILERDGLIYMQEFIMNQGRDIRVFVVNNRVLGSIYRVAPEGNWINNLSQGGLPEICELTPEQEILSLKASAVTGAVYSGVDIIEGDRSYILEVNGTPSGKGIFDASGVNVTQSIVEYLHNLL